MLKTKQLFSNLELFRFYEQFEPKRHWPIKVISLDYKLFVSEKKKCAISFAFVYGPLLNNNKWNTLNATTIVNTSPIVSTDNVLLLFVRNLVMEMNRPKYTRLLSVFFVT